MFLPHLDTLNGFHDGKRWCSSCGRWEGSSFFSASLRVYLDQLLKKHISAHHVGADVPLSQHHRRQLDRETTEPDWMSCHQILSTASKSWASHGIESFPRHCCECSPCVVTYTPRFLNNEFCLMVLLCTVTGFADCCVVPQMPTSGFRIRALD